MDHDQLQKPVLASLRAITPSDSAPAHRKKRSHSRGNSIVNFDDILSLPVPNPSSIPSPPRSRPTSHHRRLSSVSTRRESSEVMGVTFNEDSKDNAITSSRVDSHLRALFALEGRTSPTPSPLATAVFGPAKVDLPEFGAEDKSSDSTAPLPSKPSYPASSSLAGKRDSFGKLLAAAPSVKKELGILLEEDEGEDPAGSDSELVPVPAARHRPRSLNLRSSLLSKASTSILPTPSPTPSSGRTPKLKSLTLASSSVMGSSQGTPPRRSSQLVISSSVPLLSAAELEMTQRQGSISYRKPSSTLHRAASPDAALSSLFLNLPMANNGGSSNQTTPLQSPRSQTLTPSPSPTFELRSNTPPSRVSRMTSPQRSTSPTELLAQTSYYANSHASFVARIAELEAALARTRTLSPAPTEPSEELLEMLSDLKAERDQLKHTLDLLTSRFGELEKQLSALGRKLDNEKREAWVSKEKLRTKEEENRQLDAEKEALREELEELKRQLSNARSAVREERDKRVAVERELQVALDTPRVAADPYPYATNYIRNRGSFDSQVTHSEAAYQTTAPVSVANGDEDDDSDASFHSRSLSHASFTSRKGRDTIASDWSFAKAARRAKAKSKHNADPFFAGLEDEDENTQVVESGPSDALKPLTPRAISSPGPFTSSSGVSSSGASGVLSSPGAYSIGFGFGLSADEDEDSNFNFGQPPSPSLSPKNDSGNESDREISSSPLVDDEDATFSFACQTSDESHSTNKTINTPSLAQVMALSTPSLPSTPSPSMPNFSDPATPRPRHKAKDSMSLRRRSKMERPSTDLSDSSHAHSTQRHVSPPPRTSEESVPTSPRSEPSFSFPRSAPAPKPARFSMLVAPTLDISIPSSDFGSLLPSFDFMSSPAAISAPPPAHRPEIASMRPPPPISMPSPARRLSESRSSLGQATTEMTQQNQPAVHGHKSSLSLSLASLASLLPSSWSPRASPTSPVASIGNRNSLERALASREKQLSRLAEQMGQSVSPSDHRPSSSIEAAQPSQSRSRSGSRVI
ncbi:SubName: Full=Related to proteophosphoglycan ppg4-Leishmania braziliensis {ECO:0000313/EMBL:CCA71746.1} [Serendipita indica DSM 11827]|uniref:Related to proteophosphoglycan ppg4-Leishmania braziliensis n=1 Tax=Serendipita indica (strain DSM 11827) TaxID=1109443 RepID=G4TKB5_SERID|nr:SubName: Full=Related to proteophosphoglycan ppg4-Leishmania braziliensis {ECO:0000313/EMBL:CCA71746.1} [Serendipita indica DSM 11827]CCA71746.1 related to proteophosphoglycan ppg4-Leishmania braziliensis [Serendipita indica DSM 11827]